MKPLRRVAGSFRKSVLAPLFLALACLPPATGQIVNEPLQDFVTTDGTVATFAITNNVLYLGGAFTQVGRRTGGCVPFNPVTGLPESVYPAFNGEANSMVPDGQGGLYAGGIFTLVGGLIRTNLVHIRADRSVDPNWTPSAAGGSVNTMALSGSTLCLGGDFTSVNGQIRNHFAAVDAVSGALASWNPNADGSGRALAVYGTNIYIGGSFTNAGGVPRNRIAAVDVSTGQVTSWNPGADSDVYALLLSGGRLFVGGQFLTLGGLTRIGVGSFNLGTGLLESWNPAGNSSPSQVFSMGVSQNTIYLGGYFSAMGGSNRVCLAAVDMTTGLATAFDGRISGSNLSVQSVGVYSNLLYIGGLWSTIGGQPRTFAAALDPATGNLAAWDPRMNMVPLAYCAASNTFYVGGMFGAVGCIPRTNLAAFDLGTKQVTAWAPYTLTDVQDMAIAGTQVYLGGEFTNVCGQPRAHLASVDLNTGAVSSWNPGTDYYVKVLGIWGNYLYAGGAFRNVAGTPRTNLAEFDLTSGALTSWDPRLGNGIVRSMEINANTLYVGGVLTSAGGVTHRGVVSYDLTSRTVTSWDPGIASTGSPDVEAISRSGSRIFLGGRFVSVGGYTRTNFVAVDAATAAVLPLRADTDGMVYGLAAATNAVFIGGQFQNIVQDTAVYSRSYLAALDPNSGGITSWNPGANFTVLRTKILPGTLYVGGFFYSTLGNETTAGIAAFPLTLVGPPGIVPNSVQRYGNGIQFQLNAVGVPQATVLVSTNLVNWQTAQTVPLVAGSGLFTDSGAGSVPKRFYRLSAP